MRLNGIRNNTWIIYNKYNWLSKDLFPVFPIPVSNFLAPGSRDFSKTLYDIFQLSEAVVNSCNDQINLDYSKALSCTRGHSKNFKHRILDYCNRGQAGTVRS